MHQILSPLATASFTLKTVLEFGNKVSLEDQRKFISAAVDRIAYVQSLSKKLLELEGIRRGDLYADVGPVDVIDVVRNEVHNRSRPSAKQQVAIAFHLSEPNRWALADPEGLRVVLGALLDNAIESSEQSPARVDVAVSKEEEKLRITITDQGEGIPADEQPRLFDILYRGRGARKRRPQGLGMGLCIAKELVERYGGQIEIKSEVGVGTEATAWFPFASAAAGKTENVADT